MVCPVLLAEEVLSVSLAASRNRCATRMKKETSIAWLETGWVVPGLWVHGQVTMTVVALKSTSLLTREGHMVTFAVLQAAFEASGSLSFVEQIDIWARGWGVGVGLQADLS